MAGLVVLRATETEGAVMASVRVFKLARSTSIVMLVIGPQDVPDYLRHTALVSGDRNREIVLELGQFGHDDKVFQMGTQNAIPANTWNGLVENRIVSEQPLIVVAA